MAASLVVVAFPAPLEVASPEEAALMVLQVVALQEEEALRAPLVVASQGEEALRAPLVVASLAGVDERLELLRLPLFVVADVQKVLEVQRLGSQDHHLVVVDATLPREHHRRQVKLDHHLHQLA